MNPDTAIIIITWLAAACYTLLLHIIDGQRQIKALKQEIKLLKKELREKERKPGTILKVG